MVGAAQLAGDKEASGKRYLRYFPEAQTYFAMHDFSFYRIQPLSLRYIGGFGKIYWVKAEDYAVSSNQLLEQEEDFLAQINTEQQALLRRYCQHVYNLETYDVNMIGVDMDGFDLRADGRVLRFDFSEVVMDAEAARHALLINLTADI